MRAIVAIAAAWLWPLTGAASDAPGRSSFVQSPTGVPRQEPAAVQLDIPPVVAARVELERPASLLRTDGGHPAAEAVLVAVGDAVESYEVPTLRRRWRTVIRRPVDLRLVACLADAMVLADRTRLWCLDRDSGLERWVFRLGPKGDGLVPADPEESAAISAAAAFGRRAFAASDRGEWVCVDLRDGRTLWRRSDHLAARGRLLAGKTGLAHLVQRGAAAELVLRDVEGTVTDRGAFGAGQAPLWLGQAGTGVFVVAGADFLAAYRFGVGPQRWRWTVNERFALAAIQLAGDHIYLASPDGEIRARDLTSGRLVWSWASGATERGVPWMAVGESGVWRVGPGEAALIDPRTGRPIASITAADAALPDPALIPPVLWQAAVVGATGGSNDNSIAGRLVGVGLAAEAPASAWSSPLASDGMLRALHVVGDVLIVLDERSITSYVRVRPATCRAAEESKVP